ncbi:undecaprenyl-diphosphate phosphatase [Acetobacteraceae bacterium]|nr:undecaprenyl-diphosphate phosphatase [Candidatus Parcubacteria bacterium]
MTPMDSLILGVVEGITEFFPISSTGHLILASSLLNIEQSNFQKSFEIIIQLGAICSVIFLYWRSFLDFEILKKIFVAFLPTAVIGLALYKVVKTYLIGNEAVVLWALGLGGAALIIFEFLHKEKDSATATVSHMTYSQAALVGLAQAVAIIPGVSRSAATILGGLLLGIRRATIVEFSFLLAVPTMLAATGLDLVQNASTFSRDQFGVLAIGFSTSFIVAILSIKFLLSFIRTHTFVPFGIYRIALSLLFFFLIFS